VQVRDHDPAPASVRLADGRRLAYAEYGDPRGTPAFYFHGTPGSRLEAGMLDEAARREGVRLIGVDRPGYGDSDRDRRHTLAGWADDVAQLADALGIGRFGIVALSGGGPHAEAVAARLGERVTALVIASGAGPLAASLDAAGGRVRRWLTRCAAWIGLLLAPLFAWWMAYWARRMRPWMLRWLVDPRVMARPTARAAFLRDFREALRQGGSAVTRELRLFAGDWGFALADIHTPALLLHGEADRVVPVAVGRWVAARLPSCEARFYAGEGHLMLFDHGPEALRFIRHHAA